MNTVNSRQLQRRVLNLLPDLDGTLVIGLEEVVRAVVFDCLSAVLPNVEDCNGTGRKTSTKCFCVLVVE